MKGLLLNATTIARTPQTIAIERAKEAFVIVIIPLVVVACLPALAALQSDLTACAAKPTFPCAINWSVWLTALYSSLAAVVGAGATAAAQYVAALKSASNNVQTTGTTAPLLTAAAPRTAVVGSQEVVTATKPTVGY